MSDGCLIACGRSRQGALEQESRKAGRQRYFMGHPESQSCHYYSPVGLARKARKNACPQGRQVTRRSPSRGHLQRQHPAAVVADHRRHPAGRALFDQEDYASAATGAADLGCRPAVFRGDRNEFVDQRRRDPRSIGAPQLPFLAQQSGHFVPVRTQQRLGTWSAQFRQCVRNCERPACRR